MRSLAHSRCATASLRTDDFSEVFPQSVHWPTRQSIAVQDRYWPELRRLRPTATDPLQKHAKDVGGRVSDSMVPTGKTKRLKPNAYPYRLKFGRILGKAHRFSLMEIQRLKSFILSSCSPKG